MAHRMDPGAGEDVVATVLWRRVDTAGHEACRLIRRATGWRVAGTAVFQDEDGAPAQLAYAVDCDPRWHTLRGEVRGWRGAHPVAFVAERTAPGGWTLNGAVVPGLEAYVDLDLGFTPATNLQQMRRVALAVGESAEVPVAWLDVMAGTLAVLPQRYERRAATAYWYEAPSAGYRGLLELAPSGFIRRYPGLWEAEA